MLGSTSAHNVVSASLNLPALATVGDECRTASQRNCRNAALGVRELASAPVCPQRCGSDDHPPLQTYAIRHDYRIVGSGVASSVARRNRSRYQRRPERRRPRGCPCWPDATTSQRPFSTRPCATWDQATPRGDIQLGSGCRSRRSRRLRLRRSENWALDRSLYTSPAWTGALRHRGRRAGALSLLC